MHVSVASMSRVMQGISNVSVDTFTKSRSALFPTFSSDRFKIAIVIRQSVFFEIIC